MYNILIADDEPFIRDGIKNFIDWPSLDCQVVATVSNGLAALSYITEHPVDILITDIRMPGLTGLELLKEIQTQKFPVKSLILSGYSDFCYAQEALRLGVIDFILKDNPLEKIQKGIQTAIAEIEKEALHALEINTLQHKLESSQIELRDKFFLDLIYHSILDESEKEKKFLLYCQDQFPYYILLAQAVSNQTTSSNTSQEIPNFLNSISNFLTLNFASYTYTVFAVDGQRICLILKGEDLALKDVEDKCHSIFHISDHILTNMSLKIGLSSLHHDFLHLSDAFNESYNALMSLKPREYFRAFTPQFNKIATSNTTIIKIIRYLETHYQKDIPLNTLADYVALNPSYLSRIFKKETGKSITEYLFLIRIEHAKKLLTQTNNKLSFIAETTGFNDTAYFSNMFKKATGYTPSEYRIIQISNDQYIP